MLFDLVYMLLPRPLPQIPSLERLTVIQCVRNTFWTLVIALAGRVLSVILMVSLLRERIWNVVGRNYFQVSRAFLLPSRHSTSWPGYHCSRTSFSHLVHPIDCAPRWQALLWPDFNSLLASEQSQVYVEPCLWCAIDRMDKLTVTRRTSYQLSCLS